MTQRSAKLIYEYEVINKLPEKLKIEINTTGHLQILSLRSEAFNVKSDW